MSADRGDRITQRAQAGGNVTIAGRDINNNYYPSAQPTLPGLLPRDVPAFTGRDDELARLAALAGGGRVVVSAIGGTAGVGKTALAVHAAHQLLEQFPGGHLYADLRGYTDGTRGPGSDIAGLPTSPWCSRRYAARRCGRAVRSAAAAAGKAANTHGSG